MDAASNVTLLAVPGEDLVRISPGDYAVCYVRHVGVSVFRTPKVRVDFQPLAHPGLILSRWYRVTDFRGGRIRSGRHSDIVRELSAAFGRRIRHDRIAVSALAGAVVTAVVKDVVADRNQRKLADVNRYSIIERLLAWEP